MKTDFIFVSCISGHSKTTNEDFNRLHYVFKDSFGNLVTNSEYVNDPEVLKQVRDLTPLKTYSADVRYINKRNVFISLF